MKKSFETTTKLINPSEKDVLKVVKKIEKLNETKDGFNLPIFKAINTKTESKE